VLPLWHQEPRAGSLERDPLLFPGVAVVQVEKWDGDERAVENVVEEVLLVVGDAVPPSAACEPSHWDLVRNAVRVRSIAFYWLGETVATLCAPDGRYSLEDLEAFLRDLEECEGENAC
jgi:hypothetical protein